MQAPVAVNVAVAAVVVVVVVVFTVPARAHTHSFGCFRCQCGCGREPSSALGLHRCRGSSHGCGRRRERDRLFFIVAFFYLTLLTPRLIL